MVRFCTAWPEGLDTEEDVEEHFPITLTYSDHSSSSSFLISINIKALPLVEHAKDKLISLVGEHDWRLRRYCWCLTGVLTGGRMKNAVN